MTSGSTAAPLCPIWNGSGRCSLIHELPPWSRNFTSRAVRRSKLHVADTGLAANLLGVGPEMLAQATALATGPLLHTGPQSLTVGDRLHLRPISILWSNPH